MTRHTSKHHDDDDGKMDSTRLLEERKAKIQAENKEKAEDKEIAAHKGLVREGETREQLLDRIRAMRNEKPPVVTGEVFRSEGIQKEYDLEVKAGQEAVAKAAAEAEKYRTAVARNEAEGEKNKHETGREGGST